MIKKSRMRYLITGKYDNGDDYAEATESLAELAYIISEINRWGDDMSLRPDQRIGSDNITIETEEI